MVKAKPLEVQYTIPDPELAPTNRATPSGEPPLPGAKAVEAMPQPSV